jgi:hypothetical protein
MTEEGEQIAQECLSAIQATIEFTESCSAEGWNAVTSEEGWPVAVVIRHIAEAGKVLVGFAAAMAAGGDVETTTAEIDAWNGVSVAEWSQTTREDAIRLLSDVGTIAAGSVKTYSREQLASWHRFAIYGQGRTTARMAQGFALHTLEHLESAREAVAGATGPARLTAAGTKAAYRRVAG